MMSKPKWTENQQKAIVTPASVLVNAAAGSGKTAVLVERIIEKIRKGETSIDRLLIVTFAKDAAAQMQQRLKKAIISCIAESPDVKSTARMRKELRLLNHSDITTIDAFCISVVRKNFHLLGIDPGFKIIDSEEAKIMLSSEISDFLNEMYENGDERITLLSDYYSDGFSDYSLKKMIEELYKFTRSLTEPAEWLKNCANMYKDFKNSIWYEYISSNTESLISKLCEKTKSAADAMMEYALGEVKDIEKLSDDECEILKNYDNKGLWDEILADLKRGEALTVGGWDNIYNTALEYSVFSKEYMSGDFKAERKEIIDKKNEAVVIAKKLSLLYEAEEDRLSEIYEKGIYPAVSVLAEVLCEFEEYYLNSKHKKNNYEFNDLEHFCYRLLKDFEEVRAEYSSKYDEILMDEYQDTNALQEGIFDLISDKRFMVGDMKQSIYRFRNSDPFIFKAKDKLYSEKGENGTRIILSENFRSRPQVLKSINEIFKRIMSENAGEIDYDETQSLKWGNKSYENPEDDNYFSELYILEGKDVDGDEEDNSVRIEARFVASKIKQMIDSGFLVNDGGQKRPATPGDFVIIQSAVRSSGDIFVRELKKAGLDGYSENEGYFDKTEVRLMLSLIEIINNPRQDIPLVAVLRSVLFSFSEDDLAQIRLLKKGSFFDAVSAAAKLDSDFGKKSASFCEKLSRWRDYSKYMSSDRLIWTLFEETDFYDLMGVIYDGEEAQANLRLLFEKAKQYEKTGFRGLFRFLEYIKRMEENAKVASASLISDNKNAVRIMTIHKSKGLEFPVCIFAGAGKHFQSTKTGKLCMHKDWGIGINFVDPKKGYFSRTAVQELIKDVQKKEEKAETLRKLYVGMTRAKEKLIVVGTIPGEKFNQKGEQTSGYNIEREKWNTFYNPCEDRMRPEVVNSVNRFIDLIAPIVLTHKSECGWKSAVIPYNPELEEESKQNVDFEETEIDSELVDELMNLYNKVKKPLEVPSKISVTGIERLKKRIQTEDDISDFELEKKHTDGLEDNKTSLKRPAFLQDGTLTGAERGTAYHTFLSQIDIKTEMDLEFIREQLKSLTEKGILSEAESKSIVPTDIEKFFSSPLGKRLASSERAFREEAFEILINSGEVTENDEFEESQMLLQGVIDCLFLEDNELVLLDYKTDRGLTDEEFLKHYKNQLMWYKKAAEHLTKMRVKEVYLYSFEKNTAIQIK